MASSQEIIKMIFPYLEILLLSIFVLVSIGFLIGIYVKSKEATWNDLKLSSWSKKVLVWDLLTYSFIYFLFFKNNILALLILILTGLITWMFITVDESIVD